MKAIVAYFAGVLAIAIFLSQMLLAFTGVLAMVDFGSKIQGGRQEVRRGPPGRIGGHMMEITVVPAPPLVEAPTAMKPGALSAFLHSAYERLQKPIAQHALKSDLNKLVSMAKDHEANGLAAGHEYYQLLYKLACEKAEAYADLRGIDKQQLYAELASLEVLRKLANPGAQSAKAGVLVVVLGAVLIPIAIGLGSGMVAMGYRWALHIFGVH